MDYKTKYLELRAKMLENCDVSYRLGMEEGLKQAKLQALQDQVAQQQQQLAAQQQAAQQGQPGPEQGMEPGMEQGPESGQEQAQLGPESGQEQLPEGQPGQPGQEQSDQFAQQPGMVEQAGEPSELDQHIEELESLVRKGEKPSVLSMREAVLKLSDLRKSQKEEFKRKHTQIASSQKQFINNILKKWEDESKDLKNNDELTKILEESIIKPKE